MLILVLSSLHNKYAKLHGPYQDRAQKIYGDLRRNVIDVMVKNFESNGYIWEQYDDINGAGKRQHPFTGWSALIVNIMAEKY